MFTKIILNPIFHFAKLYSRKMFQFSYQTFTNTGLYDCNFEINDIGTRKLESINLLQYIDFKTLTLESGKMISDDNILY